MKILEIIPSLHSAGAEKFVVELCNEYQSRRYISVTLLQLHGFKDSDILRHALKSDIKIFTLDKPAGASINTFLRLYKFIKKGKFDVVHCHTSAIPYIVISALLVRKTRYFATIHSEASREAEGGLPALIRKFMFKTKLCQAVTISEESQKSFMDYYNLNAPIVYNGVSDVNDKDLLYIKPSNVSEFNFVHIARTHTIKNQALLYTCINRINDEGHNVRLYHYGRFSDPLISQQLVELNDAGHILIAGETDSPQSVLSKADALCLCSKMEGMPMTIIEAFSVGTPVIATPVGGCINMIQDGVNGILSEDMSENSYLTAIRRFIAISDEERLNMRANARKSFSKYNIKTCADNYLKVFQQYD